MRSAQSKEDLHQKISTGEYYKDALEWFNFIYVYPVIQRTLLATITICCVAINLIAVYSIYTFLPVVIQVPLAVNIDDIGELYSSVRKLGDYEDNATYAVGSYLVREYVEFRENYKYEDIDSKENFIKQFSTPEIYNQYVAYMDIRNAASPVSRFKENGYVRVQNVVVTIPSMIKDYRTAKDAGTPINEHYKATVTFDAMEALPSGISMNRYQSNITFTMSNVEYDALNKKFTPLDFRVEDYIVTQISSTKLQS